jgi:hypothetical protein
MSWGETFRIMATAIILAAIGTLFIMWSMRVINGS